MLDTTNLPLVSCHVLTKRFGNKLVLDALDLQVQRGKIIGLLAPNGAGKTTLIKLLCGLMQPTEGAVYINGMSPCPATKAMVSYLPDRPYTADWMRTADYVDLFTDFYADFDRAKALEMLSALHIGPNERIKNMSKGTKEKTQLAMTMSRAAQLYLLDEPIAGVDPAARDFILKTILTNYNENGTVLLSTHLIADIEQVLDEVILLNQGKVMRHDSVDNIRQSEGKSVDAYFRDIFRAAPFTGGDF